jgi:hypothetical protein
MSILMSMNDQGPRVREFVRRYWIWRHRGADNAEGACCDIKQENGADGDRGAEGAELRILAGKWPSTADLVRWRIDLPNREGTRSCAPNTKAIRD